MRVSDGGEARHEGPRSEVEVIADLAERIAAEAPVDWVEMRKHASIRSAIAKIVPGFEEMEGVNDSKREFTIANRIFHEPTFPTASGRALFHATPIPQMDLHEDELILMTVRSEGQFNTVVYEEEDLYRGQERRDVILMHPEDMSTRGISEDELVEVTSEIASIEVRARGYEIARGCACMYYPGGQPHCASRCRWPLAHARLQVCAYPGGGGCPGGLSGLSGKLFLPVGSLKFGLDSALYWSMAFAAARLVRTIDLCF